MTEAISSELILDVEPPPLPTNSAVASLAAHIRNLERKHRLSFVVEVGRLITEQFFGGDISLIRQRGPKDMSLKQLAEQPDMPLSLTQLSRAVSIFEATASLGEVATWQHLSMSHIRTVLALPPPDQEHLLKRAEEERWSVRKLESHVGEKRQRKAGGGRPPLPRFVKSVRALRHFVNDNDAFAGLDTVGELRKEDAADLYRTVTAMKLKCEELQARLRDRVPQASTE